MAIQIPFAREEMTGAETARRMAYIETGAAEEQMWSRVAALGRIPIALANEQETLQLANAQADYRASLEEFAVTDLARTDLGQPDQTGYNGFQTGPQRFDKMAKESQSAIVARISPRIRSRFRMQSDIDRRDAAVSYSRMLNARAQQFTDDDVRAKAISAANTGYMPAAMDYLEAALPLVSSDEKRRRIIADAKETGYWALIRDSPEMAEEMLKTDKAFDDPTTRTRLIAAVQAQREGNRREQDRLQREEIETVGRTIYGDLIQWQATGATEGPPHTLAEATQIWARGGMTKEVYDAVTSILTDKGTPDPQTAVLMEAVLTEVAAGRMTVEDGQKAEIGWTRKLTPAQRAKYWGELVGKQSAWVADLRDRGSRVIDQTFMEEGPGTLKAMTSRPAMIVAQLRFYDLLREAQDKGEPLLEDKFIPLAINIATDLKTEYSRDKKVFETKYGFTGTAEPKTYEEFERMVRTIPDDTMARAYYERWRGKF